MLCWRCAEDVFKTCLEDQQMFAGLLLKGLEALSKKIEKIKNPRDKRELKQIKKA